MRNDSIFYRLKLLLIIIDGLSLPISFFLYIYLYFSRKTLLLSMISINIIFSYIIVGVVYFLIFYVFLSLFYNYHQQQNDFKISDIIFLSEVLFIIYILIYLINHLLHIKIPLLDLSIIWLLNNVLISFFRYLFYKYNQYLRKKNKLIENVILIGNRHNVANFREYLKQNHHLGYQVKNSFFTPLNSKLLEYVRLYIKNYNNKLNIRKIFILDPKIKYKAIVDLIMSIDSRCIEILIHPNIIKLKQLVFYKLRLDRYIYLNLSSSKIISQYAFMKRLMEIIISFFLLLFTIPLILFAVICILISSSDPVIFKQKRVTTHGKVFIMYKLCTMVFNPDKNNKTLKRNPLKPKRDPRVIPGTRFLRVYSIDELPQLINVFKGEMNLIGPRPEEPRWVKYYDEKTRLRLIIKPGITGLQQVTCRSSNSMAERLKYDMQYINNQSLLFDIYILIKTIFAVISGINAY